MLIITLSKGIFSGAQELARRVSENLGDSLVSREEIVEETAQYGLPGDRLEWARRRRLGVLARKDLEWIHYLVYARLGYLFTEDLAPQLPSNIVDKEVLDPCCKIMPTIEGSTTMR